VGVTLKDSEFFFTKAGQPVIFGLPFASFPKRMYDT